MSRERTGPAHVDRAFEDLAREARALGYTGPLHAEHLTGAGWSLVEGYRDSGGIRHLGGGLFDSNRFDAPNFVAALKLAADLLRMVREAQAQ